MDKQIGKLINQLKEDNLYDETNHLTMYSDDKFASLGWRYKGENNWRIYNRKVKIKNQKIFNA